MWHGIGYSAVLNSYLEYSLDDNHTVYLSFQSTIMHVFHAAVLSIKCCVTFCDEQNAKLLGLTISDNLTWNVHVNEIIKKASKNYCISWFNLKERECPPQI